MPNGRALANIGRAPAPLRPAGPVLQPVDIPAADALVLELNEICNVSLSGKIRETLAHSIGGIHEL